MSLDLPVTIEFDEEKWCGLVSFSGLAEKLPNLHEYFLAPSYRKNDDGTFTMIGYGLIHRSHLPTEEALNRKYGKGNY